MVAAADRAAVTFAAWGTNPSAHLERAPPLSGEALHGGAPNGSLRKGSCHARQRMTEDKPTSRFSCPLLLKCMKAHPPWPPSAEGGGPSAEADGGGYALPPQRNPSAHRKRAEGFLPQTPQGRGGSVSRRDLIPKQKNAPIFHGRASLKESSSLFPAALRVGVRGRRFSQRSGLPRSTPFPALTSMPPLLIRSLSCLDRRFDRGRRVQ